jgi:CheY-like chemotaxis protein
VTPKLLLADDSVTIQRVIELTFADEDVQVLAVGDGRQAIERVQAERPDIVLADVGMPERDGYEVAAFIKGDPQLAHIPVLLLTGAFEPVDEVRARAVGCDGVLVKPFEPQMVISRVRDLLSGTRDAEPLPATTPIAARHAPSQEQPASAPAAESVLGSSLEDYFDRLDAALASKVAPLPTLEPRPPAAARTTPPESPRVKPAPAPAPQPPVVAGSPSAVRPDVHTIAKPAPPTPIPAAPPPTAAPAAAVPATPPSVPHTLDTPVPEPSLQEAFAALLAAEQAAVAPQQPSRIESLSSEIVDEIANRVIARLGDESMRAAVLDTAERLVRDEIARIKAQS